MDLSRRYPVGAPAGLPPGPPPGPPTGPPTRIMSSGLPLGLLPQPPRHLQGDAWGQPFQARARALQERQHPQVHMHPQPQADPYGLQPLQYLQQVETFPGHPAWHPAHRIRHLLQPHRKHSFPDFQHPLQDPRESFAVPAPVDRRQWRRQQRLLQQQHQENLLQQQQLERLLKQPRLQAQQAQQAHHQAQQAHHQAQQAQQAHHQAQQAHHQAQQAQQAKQAQQAQQALAHLIHRPPPLSASPPQAFGSERWSAFHRVSRDSRGGHGADLHRLPDGEIHRPRGLLPPPPAPPTAPPPAPPTAPPPVDGTLPVLLDKPNINFSNTSNDEVVHFLCPRLPGPDNWSGKRITNLMKDENDLEKFDLAESPESDRYLSNTSPVTESELPIKKRKPRVTDSKIESGQTVLKRVENNSETNLFSLSRYFCELTASSNQCYKCQQMQNLEALPGPTGKFCSWNSLIVQQWLLRELKASYPSNVICCLLQKLEGKNGIALSTFTKKELRKCLDNIEGHQAVYDLICQKLSAESLCIPPDSGTSVETNTHNSNQIPVSQQTRININKPRRRRDKCVGQLWEFIYSLLVNPETNPSVVTWENKDEKLFRIVNTEEIARRWGDHKGNKNMTYANMSRTMRYYREGNGAFVRNDRKRVYGFGPKADFKRLEMKLAKRR